MIQSRKEKKNKQMGAIVSVGAHVIAILLFLFMIAWRAPDPPMPEIGIELNFGLDEAGTGEIQPEPNTQAAESESEEEAAPDGLEETPEEVVEEVTESVDDPTESDETPTEEVATPVNNTQDSPDVVEEQPEPIIKEETKEEVKKEVETPKMVYPGKTSGAGGKDGDSNEAKDVNQGNDDNKIGDKGSLDGTADSKNFNGEAGGGGGSELNMEGWGWDTKPDPKEKTSESGTIVFKILVNDRGEIRITETSVSTVSPALLRIYRDEVLKHTLVRTSGSSSRSGSYTGTITFKIKAN